LQALRPSIPALTSLRFFAALVVVLNHYDARQALLPFAIFDRGYEAVTFFFVLSGFILTYVHCTGPDLRQLNISSRVFMVARAARILPAYYLALGLAAPFFLYSFFVAQTLAWPNWWAGSSPSPCCSRRGTLRPPYYGTRRPGLCLSRHSSTRCFPRSAGLWGAPPPFPRCLCPFWRS